MEGNTKKYSQLGAKAQLFLTDLMAVSDSNGVLYGNKLQDFANFFSTTSGVDFKGSISAGTYASKTAGWYFATNTGDYIIGSTTISVDVSDTLTIIIVPTVINDSSKVEVPLNITTAPIASGNTGLAVSGDVADAIAAETAARNLQNDNLLFSIDSQSQKAGIILESYIAPTLATGTSGSFFTKTYSLTNDIYISNIITHATSKYLEYLNDADEVLETVFGYGKTLTNRIIPNLTGATKVKLYSQSNTITVKVLEKVNSKIKKEADRFNKVAQILKEIGTELVPKTSDETVGSVYKFRFPYTFNTIINHAFVTSSSGIWIEVFNSSNVSIDQIRPEIGVSYVENYLLPNYPTALDASYFKICIPAANYSNGITVSKAKLIVTEDKLDKFTKEKLGTGVFKSTSTFGILGNGQGMLEIEAKNAFKFLTAKETDLYIFDVYWHATNPFYLTLKRESDDTIFGTIQDINPLSNEYQLYPIITTGSNLYQRGVIGYASIKGSEIKRLQTGLFSSKPIFNIDTAIYERMRYSPNKLINLWGDSLTAIGSGYGDYFITNQTKYLASTLAIGGETTKQIAARMGTIPFKIGADFTIPATTDPISINLKSSWDNSTCFPRADFGGYNPVYINGIKGNISVISAGVSANFTRLEAGNAIDVKTNTIVISDATNYYDDTLHVIWVGQNGGFTTDDDLLAQWDAITNPLQKYLVITPHLNTNDNIELNMRKKFGSRYYNMREWCVNYGLTEAGITPTTADNDAIALGNCPPSLLSDGTHFIESVQEIIAQNIWKRLIELGYIIL